MQRRWEGFCSPANVMGFPLHTWNLVFSTPVFAIACCAPRAPASWCFCLHVLSGLRCCFDACVLSVAGAAGCALLAIVWSLKYALPPCCTHGMHAQFQGLDTVNGTEVSYISKFFSVRIIFIGQKDIS